MNAIHLNILTLYTLTLTNRFYNKTKVHSKQGQGDIQSLCASYTSTHFINNPSIPQKFRMKNVAVYIGTRIQENVEI